MRQTIYKKDHSENIKIFSDIKCSKGYSNYTTNLDRAFRDQSYSNFYKELINPKRHKCNSFIKLFERDNSSKVQKYKNSEETFNMDQFAKSLKIMEAKEKEKNEKLKNPFLERLRKKNKLLKRGYRSHATKKLKPYFPKVPELGKYNPSYDIITKHSFQVRFGNTEPKTSLEKQKTKNFIEDYKISKKNKNIITPKKTKILKIKNKTVTKNFTESNNNKYNNNSNFNKTFTGTNHCLKFEVYTPRKPLSNKVIYDSGRNFEIPNYYTDKYIHTNVDFNKLFVNSRKKSYFDQECERHNYPPLGLYHPKFESVMNKTRDVYLNKKEIMSPKKKELNKIIYSYHVSSKYLIAPTLNDYGNSNTEN